MRHGRKSNRRARFQLGIETLLDRPPSWLKRSRIGLVCHPASVDRNLIHSADRLHDAIGDRLVALFGPQHGARGEKQDNMIESADYCDPRLKIPVHSLYGKYREPTDEMLRGVDVLLFDLQDVGTRVYTFVSTMAACLRATARAGCKFIVLDRPNPIGGAAVEGRVLDPEYRSFVGELSIPMRHGMTVGELALWANTELGLNGDLEVVRMRNWRRADYWDDLGICWVAPSPNMPTLETALVYPGMVLFEGTNVSEGRGTTRPFEIVGAPFIDPERLVDRADEQRLAGCKLRPLYFEPTFHKFHGQLCGGVQVHVTDRTRFLPIRTALVLLRCIAQEWPAEFGWREPPYEYETRRMPVDIIAGGSAVRELISARAAMGRVLNAERTPAKFLHRREKYLLYD